MAQCLYFPAHGKSILQWCHGDETAEISLQLLTCMQSLFELLCYLCLSFLVPQSLTLWREIMHDMFRLWCLGEEDLLSEDAAYQLTDTGQGKQRVQQSPKTFKAMQVKCQSRLRTNDGTCD